MDNEYGILIEVRSKLQNGSGYRLKVSILELGIYIDGFRATRSEKNRGGWWIQPPAIPPAWKRLPEFDQKNNLWQTIERLATEAATKADLADSSSDDDWSSLSPDEFNKYLSNNIDKTIKGCDLDIPDIFKD